MARPEHGQPSAWLAAVMAEAAENAAFVSSLDDEFPKDGGHAPRCPSEGQRPIRDRTEIFAKGRGQDILQERPLNTCSKVDFYDFWGCIRGAWGRKMMFFSTKRRIFGFFAKKGPRKFLQCQEFLLAHANFPGNF